MTILLYDYRELDERASNHLRVWKVWHTLLYVLAAVFGILNYMFLQNAMYFVDNNCILYPRTLEFHWVDLPIDINAQFEHKTEDKDPIETVTEAISKMENVTDNAQKPSPNVTVLDEVVNNNAKTVKRSVDSEPHEIVTIINETTVENKNVTIITENRTSRLVLDVSRSLFSRDSGCDFAEYMPLMSTIAGLLWATLFTMCPGGGRVRSGLQQPWRILTPALLFALVLVGLTGHSFTTTNGGLLAFCAAFYNLTNATTCSSTDPYIELAWNASWGMGGRAAAARAASAGVWATWACAAALLLARCLAAPDFVVKRTGVYLIKDPAQKVTPYLKKIPDQKSKHSPKDSPSKKETVSVKSEPTVTSELVTVSVEREPDSQPTSFALPSMEADRRGEDIEMVYSPRQRSD